jgi:3-phenylpropionate/trans-cinnamate dioxygenase ferredoxin subunit
MTTENWVKAVTVEEIPLDDVTRWDHEGRTYAFYRLASNEVYATSNICTHEHAFLSDGFLENGVIECPRHSGRFDVRTGEPLGAPVCDAVKTFAVKLTDGDVFIQVATAQ